MSQLHLNKLEEIYSKAEKLLKSNKGKVFLPAKISNQEKEALNTVLEYCEQRKAVLTVLITSLCHKIINPKQDTRLHQSNLKNGYSGRTLDTKFITPFMKDKRFPAMVESGWLTRSFEQNSPYDLKYRGKVTPPKLKQAFLLLIDHVENKHATAEDYLTYLFQSLILLRENNHVDIVRIEDKSKFSIKQIIHMLEEHFEKSSVVGTARLPVLAIYSVYECMIAELKRFEGKKLLPLGSHTSADYRSGDIGDIEIIDEKETPFEGVEVKYGKPITAQMVMDAFEKFKIYPTNRYYLLSTTISGNDEMKKITKEIEMIAKDHGCQVIVNGIFDSLKYYLRLLENADQFLDKYADNLSKDMVIKAEQKRLWNEILLKR
jgi:DNA (cytosine-5)-methyltransferase 1